jgi:hypothetical protein
MKKIYLALIAVFCFVVFANQSMAMTQTTFQKNYSTLNQYFKAFNDCRTKSNLPKLLASYINVKETQAGANSLVLLKIGKIKSAYQLCLKTVLKCPIVNPPICDNGVLTEQAKDKNGCRVAPKCVVNVIVPSSGQDYSSIIGPVSFEMKKNQGINQFNSDTADFTVTFKLRASTKNIYINDDISSNPGLVLKSDNGTTSAYACTTFDGATRDSVKHQFIIPAGQTAGIQCSVHIVPDTDGYYAGYISDYIWGTDPNDSTEFHWTPDGANNTARFDILASYKSDSMYLKKRP